MTPDGCPEDPRTIVGSAEVLASIPLMMLINQ